MSEPHPKDRSPSPPETVDEPVKPYLLGANPSTEIPLDSDAQTGRAPSYEPALKAASIPVSLPARFAEDFELLRVLGKGSFGTVFLARELSLDRLVALKVSRTKGNEARTLARLEHSHIVQVFGERLCGEQRLLWMQYVPGTTLEHVIRGLSQRPVETWSGATLLEVIAALNTEPLIFDASALRSRQLLQHSDHVEAVCWLGARLAEALAYAHRQGVLHRDIKPANILINGYGRPLLADFNLASADQDTREDTFGGTLAYMAPEHLDAFNPEDETPRDAVDQRSDLYSLGVVLFELLTSKRPFGSPTGHLGSALLRELADARRAAVPDLASTMPIVPVAVRQVLRRCLEPDPAKRFQSANELAEALDGCLELSQVEKGMPVAGPLTRAFQRYPMTMGFVLASIPHTIGSLMSIGYNVVRIGGNLPEPSQQSLVLSLTSAYTGVVFAVALSLAYWVVGLMGRSLRRIEDGEVLDRAELAPLRRYALRTPLWGILLAAVGWLPGVFLVPALLDVLSTEPISEWVYLHFAISFVVAGSMALPYSMLAMQFQVVRVIYPRLLAADPAFLRQTAMCELASHPRRLFVLQLLTVLIPLVSAATIVGAGPEYTATNYSAFRWLVISLIALGVLGSVLAAMVNNRLRQAITALTGNERQRAGVRV